MEDTGYYCPACGGILYDWTYADGHNLPFYCYKGCSKEWTAEELAGVFAVMALKLYSTTEKGIH